MGQLSHSNKSVDAKTPSRLIEGNETFFLEKNLEDPWPGRLTVWENKISLVQQGPNDASPSWQYELKVDGKDIPGIKPPPKAPSDRDLPGDLKVIAISETVINWDVSVQVYRINLKLDSTPELVLDLFVRFDAAIKSAIAVEPTSIKPIPKSKEAVALPEKSTN